MTASDEFYYRAYAARDPRFDGVFFTGVISTGIYCRAVCTAKLPKAENCRFFTHSAAAESAGFRPCLRCRPELAPGVYAQERGRVSDWFSRQFDADPAASTLASAAAYFGLSARQVRRLMQQESGVTPLAYMQTRRLLLAKQLVSESRLPMIEVAFASGFNSVRRFNALFHSRYGLTPSALRRAQGSGVSAPAEQTVSLQLCYRPPYDWTCLLEYLRGRALAGAEWVSEQAYHRTVRIGGYEGWFKVEQMSGRNALKATISQGLVPVIAQVLARLRDLFDTQARPDRINTQLSQDSRLKPLIDKLPGLRVPGAFDGFELAVRAILGQQISVKAATTLSCRFVAALGEPALTPFAQLTHFSPSATRVANTTVDAIAALGIVGSRAKSIIAIAQAQTEGQVQLQPVPYHERHLQQLMALPGIGPWTAQYIAMRALRWPDAFPKEDMVLRKRLGDLNPKQAEQASLPWRPWRSYAVLHLWQQSQ